MGGGLFGHFYSLQSFLSSFSHSLGDGPIYTDILSQRAVKPKTTNQLSVPGRPTILDYSRARAYCTCSRCGWGLFGHFSLVYHFSPLSPVLWETARYRMKYCLKGPLSPKQPTNQPNNHCTMTNSLKPILLFFKLNFLSCCLTLLAKRLYLKTVRRMMTQLELTLQLPYNTSIFSAEIKAIDWTFLLSSSFSLLFLHLFVRRPDID